MPAQTITQPAAEQEAHDTRKTQGKAERLLASLSPNSWKRCRNGVWNVFTA